MKRQIEDDSSTFLDPLDAKMKKVKQQEEDDDEVVLVVEGDATPAPEGKGKSGINGLWNIGEDLLFEVLKHADARTLGRAACVSRQWKRTALDERLWELICTTHWAHIGCPSHQLRSVVLALGGFRRLHSQYLWPLSRGGVSGSSSSGSAWAAPLSRMMGGAKRWGKDEVHLSLSLLSIRYYEKMNFSSRGR